MSRQLTIPGSMPSLNAYCRANRHEQSRMKRDAQEAVAWMAKAARLRPLHGRFSARFTYYESSRKRDLDNVSAVARKIVLDALQDAGVIDNDRLCTSIEDVKAYDKADPRIVVELFAEGETKQC